MVWNSRFVCLLGSLLLFYSVSHAAPTDTSQSETNTTINSFNNTLNMSPVERSVFLFPGNETSSWVDIESVLPGNSGTNVTVAKEEAGDWIKFDGANSTYLEVPAGETYPVNFTVTVPYGTTKGVYFANITSNSSFGETMKTNLTINVTDDVGRILVTVLDSLGGRIESASVFVWDLVPMLQDTGSTDSDGEYLSCWLPPGNYTVEATKAGYSLEQKNGTVVGDQNTSFVNVTLEPTGAPVLEVSPSSISETAYTGDQVSRLLVISNTGDMTLVNVTLNSTVSWISFQEEFIASIIPSNFENVYAYLGPLSSTGLREGKILVKSANDGEENITVFFDVRSRPSSPSSNGGSTTPTSWPAPAPSNKELSIAEFSPEMNVTIGESVLLSIEVENTGDVELSDVSVSVGGPFEFTVSPASAVIEPGFTKTFLISFEVPPESEPKNHSLVLMVSGGGVSDSATVFLKVEVLKDELEEQLLTGRIQDMREIVDKVWSEAVQLGSLGNDVKDILKILQNATQKLDLAQGYIIMGDYDSARTMVETMRSLAESAVVGMSEMRTIPAGPGNVPLEIAVAAAAVFLIQLSVIVFQFVYFRGRSSKREQFHKSSFQAFIHREKII